MKQAASKMQQKRKYERAWFKKTYRARREDLVKRMGGECAVKVSEFCTPFDNLEFHHPNGRNWTPNRVNRVHRLKLYEHDWKNGECILSCNACNTSLNGKEK